MFYKKDDSFITEDQRTDKLTECEIQPDLPEEYLMNLLTDIKSENAIEAFEQNIGTIYSGSEKEVENMSKLGFFRLCDKQFYEDITDENFIYFSYLIHFIKYLAGFPNYAAKFINEHIFIHFLSDNLLCNDDLVKDVVETIYTFLQKAPEQCNDSILQTGFIIQLSAVVENYDESLEIITDCFYLFLKRFPKNTKIRDRRQFDELLNFSQKALFSETTNPSIAAKYIKALSLSFNLFENLNKENLLSDPQFDIFLQIASIVRDDENLSKYLFRFLNASLNLHLFLPQIDYIFQEFWNDSIFDTLFDDNTQSQQSKITFALDISRILRNEELCFGVLDFFTENFENFHLSVKMSFVNFIMSLSGSDGQPIFYHIIENGLINKIFKLIEVGKSSRIMAISLVIRHIITQINDDNYLDMLREIVMGEDWLSFIDDIIADDDLSQQENQLLHNFFDFLKEEFEIE